MTGGGLGTRALYTNAEEMIFDAQRPIVLNGIEEVGVRGDLLDRLISARTARIPDEQRRDEAELWASFDSTYPSIYGALLSAAACALRDVDAVRLTRQPRMADAARWVTAAEPALGWREGAFLDAYFANRSQAQELVIESSSLAPLVSELAKRGFRGTNSELLEQLNSWADDEVRKSRSWPKSAQSLVGKAAPPGPEPPGHRRRNRLRARTRRHQAATRHPGIDATRRRPGRPRRPASHRRAVGHRGSRDGSRSRRAAARTTGRRPVPSCGQPGRCAGRPGRTGRDSTRAV